MSNKPFNPALPVRTRDGRPARIICTDRKGPNAIIALIDCGDGECTFCVTPSGRAWNGGRPETDGPADLINIPEKIEGYVNVYSSAVDPHLYFYDSKEQADQFAGTDRMARLKISFEEGQFDD